MRHSSFGKPFQKGFIERLPNFIVVLCMDMWRKEITLDTQKGESYGRMKKKISGSFM